jgi:hypothetical protein
MYQSLLELHVHSDVYFPKGKTDVRFVLEYQSLLELHVHSDEYKAMTNIMSGKPMYQSLLELHVHSDLSCWYVSSWPFAGYWYQSLLELHVHSDIHIVHNTGPPTGVSISVRASRSF